MAHTDIVRTNLFPLPVTFDLSGFYSLGVD